jgi:hypothetical protein
MGKGSLGRRQRDHAQPPGLSDQRAGCSLLCLPPVAVPEGVVVEPGAGTHTELRGSSQPHRLLKVIRALSTWKRGISVRR